MGRLAGCVARRHLPRHDELDLALRRLDHFLHRVHVALNAPAVGGAYDIIDFEAAGSAGAANVHAGDPQLAFCFTKGDAEATTGGLDDSEIERMVKEAEDNAEADKEKREAIDARNQAESMIHGAEKSLSDLGDKAEDNAKKEVEDAVAELKTALEGEDISIIKEKTSSLSAVMMKMGEAAYKANEANSAENEDTTNNSSENKEDVVDADFEEVKDNEEKKDAS